MTMMTKRTTMANSIILPLSAKSFASISLASSFSMLSLLLAGTEGFFYRWSVVVGCTGNVYLSSIFSVTCDYYG